MTYRVCVTFLVTFGMAAMAMAQTTSTGAGHAYPNRPIRMVAPFPAGGGIDIVARALGQRLSMALGQAIVIDNRSGADGMIGADMVAKSPRDGYTLLFASTGPLVINPALNTRMTYNTLVDFAPVTIAVDNPMCLVIHPSIPAKNVRELIAFARARPGQINYGSGGVGNGLHLAGEIFKTITGVNIVHVPYRGGAPAVTDLVAGQVHMMISSIPMMLPQIRSGRLRALAVSSQSRMKLLPDVPTMREAGLERFNANSWYGLLAPAGTPGEIVNRLNSESVKVLRSDEMREYLAQQGSNAAWSDSPQEFSAHIKSELEKWAQVVKTAGLTPH
jgi:tripartite-type tricarboxylate transporter receptor subunit TctC